MSEQVSPTPLRFGSFVSHALGEYFAKHAISTTLRQNSVSVDSFKVLNTMAITLRDATGLH